MHCAYAHQNFVENMSNLHSRNRWYLLDKFYKTKETRVWLYDIGNVHRIDAQTEIIVQKTFEQQLFARMCKSHVLSI